MRQATEYCLRLSEQEGLREEQSSLFLSDGSFARREESTSHQLTDSSDLIMLS